MKYACTTGLVLFAVALHPGVASAVTVDECLDATGERAVVVCYRALESGSRDPRIYRRIVREHFERGEVERARVMVRTALTIHADDQPLLDLQLLVDGDTATASDDGKRELPEQYGILRSLCLTRNDSDGLTACRRYVELSKLGADDEQVAVRIAQFPAVRTTAPGGGARPGDSRIDDGYSPDPPARIEGLAAASRPEKRATDDSRAMVTEAQTRLNELGFVAGSADGVIGNATRRALGEFYGSTGLALRTDFGEETLADLALEKRRLETARELYAQSRDAHEHRRAAMARDLLSRADERSRLLEIPVDYQRELDELQIELRQLIAEIRALRAQTANRRAASIEHVRLLRSRETSTLDR